MLIFYLASILSYLFINKSIYRVIRINRRDLPSCQNRCMLMLFSNAKITKIDLTRHETPKLDLSNIKHLSKSLTYLNKRLPLL